MGTGGDVREQLLFPGCISDDELGFAAVTHIILVAYHDNSFFLVLHVLCSFSGALFLDELLRDPG